MKLNKNMGVIDRIVRIIIAALFGYLYFSGIVTGALGIILLVLGIVFLGTSLISFCPLYTLFNFSTVKEETE
jgi:hypothetical protein